VELLLVILLVLFCLGGLPNWGYHHYGYFPSGFLFILLVCLVIYMARRLPR